MTLPGAWLEQAACRGRGLLFLLDGRYKRRQRMALELCARCPVAEQCLDWVLAWDLDPCPRHIVAGLEPYQRDEMRAELRRSGIDATYELPWGLE